MGLRGSGIRTETPPIADVLEWINEGRMVLPEFQRDFDWTDEKVVALLATVVRRWPAGSLLLMEVDGPTFFELRAFQGGPQEDDESAEMVVLDGQQRLTALYHAVYDTGLSVYAIRASALTPDATIDAVEEGTAA